MNKPYDEYTDEDFARLADQCEHDPAIRQAVSDAVLRLEQEGKIERWMDGWRVKDATCTHCGFDLDGPAYHGVCGTDEPQDMDYWSDDAKYTVAVDFDGVIHSYSTPWVAAHIINDPPVPGAIEWLNEIGKKFKVVIFTTRGATEAGREAVRNYLEGYGLETNGKPIHVTHEKVAALIYVDDRGYRFDGTNFPTAEQIHKMLPWNKREMGRK